MRTILTVSLAVLAIAASAGCNVFRVEEDQDTGELRLVGADGVRRQVAILPADEYARLTGFLANAERTEQGRVLLHGPRVKPVLVDEDGRHFAYEDGYVHTERVERRGTGPLVQRTFAGGPPPASRRDGAPKRLRDIIARRKAIEAGRAREVRIDYDAGTGTFIHHGEAPR